MTFQIELIIKTPIKELFIKMDNVNNLKHWQRDLISFELLSGTLREIGSKAKLTYKLSHKKTFILEEIITEKIFPFSLDATYVSNGFHNIQENIFEETKAGDTRWICKNRLIPTNLSYRFIIALMPRAIKKQTKQFMTDFKNFAENNVSVLDKKN